MPDVTNKPNDVLLPCPFCAYTDVKIVTGDGVHFAQCRKCEATGPTGFKRGDEDDADWNSRAQLAPLQAENSRLRQHKIDYMEASEETRKALQAENDGLRKDADRYRLIRDEPGSAYSILSQAYSEGFDLDSEIDNALSKPAGCERVCHLCRGEGRVGGPAPDEGGGKNCVLCDGTGMAVQP